MQGMLQGYLPVFFVGACLSGSTWAAGAMANTGIPVQAENLQAQSFQAWKSLGTNSFSETEFQYVQAGWLQDSENALKQSINWAMQVQDADYLKQLIFMIALDRDPQTGQVSFHKTSDSGTDSTQLEYARLSAGVLTIGGYEFQVDEHRILGWRKASIWTRYESFPLPIEIPLTILELYRTQA
jgi:hypothetical protein